MSSKPLHREKQHPENSLTATASCTRSRPARTANRAACAAGLVVAIVAAMILTTQTGCLGLVSNLMHAVGVDRIPAECEALKDSKVALVTMTDQSQYSDDVAARLLARKLRDILSMEVKGMTLIQEEAIQQWRDVHGWDNLDYLQIGQDLKAEKVLAIELTDVRLRDGATLFRGRAGVMIRVVDVAEEKEIYTKEIDEYTYPVNAGQYTNETTETKFRKVFLGMLARRIGRCFHPYDFADTVALDAALASE